MSIEPHCRQDTTLAVSQQSTDTVHRNDDSLEVRSSIQPSCPWDTTPVVPQHSTNMVHHDVSLEERPSIRYLCYVWMLGGGGGVEYKEGD